MTISYWRLAAEFNGHKYLPHAEIALLLNTIVKKNKEHSLKKTQRLRGAK